MASVIFVTLKNGVYDDRWMSELADGRRIMHWCGQARGKRDGLVIPGTVVAVRPTKTTPAFTLVGTVATKELIHVGDPALKTPATYHLSIEMDAEPLTIARDSPRDRCAHWTVLRHLGIARDASYMPHGIYA
jgi:hypothetical protein